MLLHFISSTHLDLSEKLFQSPHFCPINFSEQSNCLLPHYPGKPLSLRFSYSMNMFQLTSFSISQQHLTVDFPSLKHYFCFASMTQCSINFLSSLLPSLSLFLLAPLLGSQVLLEAIYSFHLHFHYLLLTV